MTTKPENHPDELLTWYVNDTLDDAERAAVDEHLRGCARCRDEVVFLRALRRGIRAVGQADTPGELGLKRLLRDVRARQRAPSTWWRPALMAAAVVIVAQGALLATFWPREPAIAPLGATTADGATIQIQFHPAASERQIRELLHEVRGRIVDGPGAFGLYRVRIESDADRERVLTLLHERSGIVLHVAPD